jgi:hypothetical protein
VKVQRLTNETMIILILIILLSCRIYYNPGPLFEKYNNYMSQIHELELVQYANTDKKIEQLLSIYFDKYQGNRIWIIQYHRGIKDYMCGSMRFELCDKQTKSIKYQYTDFNLSWCTLPYYLRIHDSFIGKLEEVDPVLSTRSSAKYIICKLIKDYNNVPIGIFGISYLDKLPNKLLEADLQQDYIELQKLMLE